MSSLINANGVTSHSEKNVDSAVGSQGIKKVHPDSLNDLSNTNGIIRLMAQDGQELPLDKFVRYKNNINLWYQEMKQTGLTQDEMKTMEKYMLKSHGLAISQECIMWSLMDPDICGFTLGKADAARKVISKKRMDKLPALKEKVMAQAKSPAIGQYEWQYVIQPSAGYGFSDIHSLFYSMVGFQTAYIATKWNQIYWDTACLIVNSGSLENDEQSDEAEEDNAKERSTDYTKLAKALGEVISQGIKVSLIDINKSSYGFEPDIANQQILFGMKALSGINKDTIDKIIAARPYNNFKDFLKKCPLNKTAMISLIKSGAFDNLELDVANKLNIEPRLLIMIYYLSIACEPKTKLTLQNFNSLIEKRLLPSELNFEKDTFIINKWFKKRKVRDYYNVTETALDINKLIEYYGDIFDIIDNNYYVNQKVWDKLYKSIMDKAKEWLKNNQTAALAQYNLELFKDIWNKYATGTISAWEMEALCFYYHAHELADVNFQKYGIIDFNILSPNSAIDKFFKRNGKEIPIYKISRIAGTVIGKNDTRHSISLLTTTGVVNVKFSKDYYAMYARQLSEVQPDGTKKVIEKGWFVRGTKLIVTGYRREDTFVAKTYKSRGDHMLYKITKVEGRNIILTHQRWGQKNAEED